MVYTMRLLHFGFAFTQAISAIVVYCSMALLKTCFLPKFPLVPLSSQGIENLQSRNVLVALLSLVDNTSHYNVILTLLSSVGSIL